MEYWNLGGLDMPIGGKKSAKEVSIKILNIQKQLQTTETF